MRELLSDLSIREVAYRSPEYDQSVALREAVLRLPLGLSFTPEDLQRDAQEWHLICTGQDRLLGCLVLAPLSADSIQVRQVAVLPEFQRRGIGQALMKYSEKLARQRGFIRMELHARLPAVPFYERLGYEKVGQPFVQVTILHLEMQKILRTES